MTRRLILTLVALAAAVSAALAVPLIQIVTNDQRAGFITKLQVESLSTASVLASQGEGSWPETVAKAAERTGARVVVVNSTLTLVADSDNSGLDRTFDRPEIEAALLGQLTSDVRYSQTLLTNLRYVAAPVVQDHKVVAAVRFSMPEDAVDQVVAQTRNLLLGFASAVALVAALLAWFLARGMASPLKKLADVAQKLPDDLSLRANSRTGPKEVREVASAMNATAERLQGLVERSERVAAEASHHLRTPLTGLSLRLEAIEETSKDPTISKEAALANREVARLTRRIEQILALARSDAGAISNEVVNASETIIERVESAGALANERGITLVSDIDPEVYVNATPGIIARAVDELISNSLSYAKSEVRVNLHQVGDIVRLTVQDDGPGIDLDELPTLFERFRRGKKSVPGGSGLGLAMVKESAVASGGGASAELIPGGGLRIRVWWPGDLTD